MTYLLVRRHQQMWVEQVAPPQKLLPLCEDNRILHWYLVERSKGKEKIQEIQESIPPKFSSSSGG